MEAEKTIITGFKGFNQDMTCRGFQFVEGETYKHEGTVKACESGFHFCENPIDIFNYYEPARSRFFSVEGSGDIALHDKDSKVTVSDIKIGVEVKLHDLIGAGVKFLFERKYKESTSKHSTGDRSASSATGDRSASSATGDSSASSATGYSSASSATGYRSASSATGDSSASSATGYSSASSATGDRSASSATGEASAAICTGIDSKAMAGKYGCVALQWWNIAKGRAEMRCAETGCGDGSDGKLKDEQWYSLDDSGNFIEV